jgi:tRNA1Val (adenine37-N6)-methyltransferase
MTCSLRTRPGFKETADLGPLREGETLDGLLRNKVRVIQARKGYRVSEDAVILTWFARPTPGSPILDAGSGCGAIAFGLAAAEPSVNVTAIDIQWDLCDRAARGARLNGLDSRVSVLQGDVRNAVCLFRPHVFDLVVSNPPYRVPGSGRLSMDSEKAVARHQLLMPLKALFEASAHVLSPDGALCLIYPAEGLQDILRAARDTGFSLSRLLRVHSRRRCPPGLVCVEALPDASQRSLMEDALFLYDESGIRTPRAAAVLNGEQPQ